MFKNLIWRKLKTAEAANIKVLLADPRPNRMRFGWFPAPEISFSEIARSRGSTAIH
jgi:hypothetical protein